MSALPANAKCVKEGIEMAENTKISWCTHSWSPWIGCTKVSPGCEYCYAERDFDHRRGIARWGPNGTRHITKTAKDIKRIHRRLVKERRERVIEASEEMDLKQLMAGDLTEVVELPPETVFTASLSDFFEDRADLVLPRKKAFMDTIQTCHLLEFLLLTKRPQNIRKMIKEATGLTFQNFSLKFQNVTFGTSCETQTYWDLRIPELIETPSMVKLISLEPLLGPIDMNSNGLLDHLLDTCRPWIVIGGESGPDSRECHIEWIESLVDQCQQAGVACHVKQLGKNAIYRDRIYCYSTGTGQDTLEWPKSIIVQEGWPGGF